MKLSLSSKIEWQQKLGNRDWIFVLLFSSDDSVVTQLPTRFNGSCVCRTYVPLKTGMCVVKITIVFGRRWELGAVVTSLMLCVALLFVKMGLKFC